MNAMWGLCLEGAFVVAVSTVLAIGGILMFWGLISWSPWLQNKLLPGEDEAEKINTRLDELLETSEPTPVQIELIGSLAGASAQRGHARILAFAIFFAAIAFPSMLVFGPMAKTLLRSFG